MIFITADNPFETLTDGELETKQESPAFFTYECLTLYKVNVPTAHRSPKQKNSKEAFRNESQLGKLEFFFCISEYWLCLFSGLKMPGSPHILQHIYSIIRSADVHFLMRLKIHTHVSTFIIYIKTNKQMQDPESNLMQSKLEHRMKQSQQFPLQM